MTTTTFSGDFDCLATAPFGLEGVAADELRALGMRDVRAEGGGARFAATAAEAFRACLWLRCADRVLITVGRFPARTFDELFEGTRALPWERFIPPDAAFPVAGSCARSQLMSVRDCQAIVKKAIVNRLLAATGAPRLPETAETIPLRVSLHADEAALCVDLCGEGLSRRGYRTWNGEAPLRETLAASLLALAPWRPGLPLHDPLCGTGTILVEAAFRAANRAPGLSRAFACEAFRRMPRQALRDLRAEAAAAFDPAACGPISGSDIDPAALDLARRHVRQAGLEGRVALSVSDCRDLALAPPRGVFLTNPPYGERMLDRRGCEAVARALRGLCQRHPGWTLCAITAHTGFERAFGLRADRRRRLYNGRLECEFLTFFPKGKRDGG